MMVRPAPHSFPTPQSPVLRLGAGLIFLLQLARPSPRPSGLPARGSVAARVLAGRAAAGTGGTSPRSLGRAQNLRAMATAQQSSAQLYRAAFVRRVRGCVFFEENEGLASEGWLQCQRRKYSTFPVKLGASTNFPAK